LSPIQTEKENFCGKNMKEAEHNKDLQMLSPLLENQNKDTMKGFGGRGMDNALGEKIDLNGGVITSSNPIQSPIE
jgi:hypothetical protein